MNVPLSPELLSTWRAIAKASCDYGATADLGAKIKAESQAQEAIKTYALARHISVEDAGDIISDMVHIGAFV
jgi:hypothetical protein